MLSRYDPSSGFVYIPTGNQSGRGSWHPSSRDAAPPNELCFVSEPATGHHFQEVPLDDRWHPQRSAHTAWAPSPCPQPAWAPAQTPSLVVPCTCNNRSLFLKQWCRTRASSYGNKASSGFGERALVLFVAGANHTGLHSISVEAPERRQSIEP